MTTPISKFSSRATQYHLTTDLRAEVRATTGATDTASDPNGSSPDTILTMPPANLLPDYTD